MGRRNKCRKKLTYVGKKRKLDVKKMIYFTRAKMVRGILDNILDNITGPAPLMDTLVNDTYLDIQQKDTTSKKKLNKTVKTKEKPNINENEAISSQVEENGNQTFIKTDFKNKILEWALTKHTSNDSNITTPQQNKFDEFSLKYQLQRDFFNCTYCPERTAYALAIHSHIKSAHPDNDMVLRCNVCDYQTNELKPLYMHMNIKHGSQEGRVSCTYCDYTDFGVDNMIKHNKKHTFKCEGCQRIFNEEYELKKHRITCKNENKSKTESKFFLCEICGKNVPYIQLHMKRAHSSLEFSCKHCPRKFRTSSLLEKHNLTHDENGNYKCIRCNDVFNSKVNRDKHVHVVHKGLELFKCSECGYKCHTKSRFQYHCNTVHTDNPKYSCHLCGRRFKKSVDVKQHMVVHTKEQPFGCELCDKRYTQAHALRAHMRTKH